MGIIKASVSAIQGAVADQWKEAFIAGELSSDLLLARAKQIADQNSGSGDVITHGSVIIVGEGECAIATEGGKIIGIYDQPGEHIFKSNQSGGIFGGGLGAFVKDVGRRISFGGDVRISQRLYYINTKELTGGTIRADGIPLRFKSEESGLDIDGSVSCYGCYTFRITNPELFFRTAIRSAQNRYRAALLGQMDSEIATALPQALSELTTEGLRPHALLQHTDMLCQKLGHAMRDTWSGLRGIEVVSVALETVSVHDHTMLRSLQRDTAFQDPTKAAAHLVGATVDALQTAAANKASTAAAVSLSNKPADGWRCHCGQFNRSKFCTECGTKRPADLG